MITQRQIRAARALLGWDAADLAEKAGLTRATLSNIENGLVQARAATIEKIAHVFDQNGVEFTDNSGVRFKPQGVEVLVDHEGLCRFFDGVYEYLSKHGGLVMQTGVDEAMFTRYLGNYSPFHINRMTKLISEREDIKFQALICEGDTNFRCSAYAEYRWMPNELFAPVPFYVYGDELAIMSFQTIPAPTIVVHHIPAITNAYRKQFEVMWKLAVEPVDKK